MSLSTVIRATTAGFLLTVLLAVAFPATSQAGTIFSSFGPSDSFDTTSGYELTGSGVAPLAPPSDSYGGIFTASGGGAVTGVDLALHYVTGTASLRLSFWSDVGGLPGTQIGGVFSVIPPSTPGVVAVTGITGVDLTAGQSYVLELTAGGADTISFWFANNQGLFGLVDNNGSGWNDHVGASPLPAFDVTTGTAIPEPVSAAVLVFGLAATALIRGRARRAVRGGDA